MTFVDFIIIIVCIFFALQGAFKGILLEIFGVLALIAGLFASVNFSPFTATYLANIFPAGATRNMAAFIITYLLAWLLVKIMGWMLNKNLGEAETNPMSRMLGGVFGLTKIFFIVSVIIFAGETYAPGNKFTGGNKLTEKCVETAKWALEHTPLKLPGFKDLAPEREEEEEEEDIFL